MPIRGRNMARHCSRLSVHTVVKTGSGNHLMRSSNHSGKNTGIINRNSANTAMVVVVAVVCVKSSKLSADFWIDKLVGSNYNCARDGD